MLQKRFSSLIQFDDLDRAPFGLFWLSLEIDSVDLHGLI